MPTRYLKPGICDSDRIEKCDPLAETLWYRLLVNVDDYGRLDARPAVVKARCFPLKDTMTNDEVEALLRTLAYANLIQLYTDVRGCRYLQFNLWDNVPRSKESKFPPFDETCIQLYTDVQPLHTNLPVTGTETVDRKQKPKTGTGTKDLSAQKARTSQKGTELSAEWFLPKEWGEWALAEKPHWTADDVRRVAADFKDHWLANANQAKAKKADWLATWRKWVRSPLNEINTARTRKFNPNLGRDLEAEMLAFAGEDNVIEGESKNVG